MKIQLQFQPKQHLIKNRLLSVLAILVLSALSFSVFGQNRTEKAMVTIVHLESTRATIQEIDYNNRKVTLRTPNGNTMAMKVGTVAKNFDQLKKGDEISIRYYESVAVAVTKSGEAPVAMVEETVMMPEGDNKPGAVALEKARVTAVVQDVNPQNRTLTLQGPGGAILETL